MQVQLLYFDDCPNWQEPGQRLREAMMTAGCDVPVEHVHVTTTAEHAERLSFRGSPTVLVDGVDPFVDPDDPVGLSCRMFRTLEGLRGAPTVQQLVEALRPTRR